MCMQIYEKTSKCHSESDKTKISNCTLQYLLFRDIQYTYLRISFLLRNRMKQPEEEKCVLLVLHTVQGTFSQFRIKQDFLTLQL